MVNRKLRIEWLLSLKKNPPVILYRSYQLISSRPLKLTPSQLPPLSCRDYLSLSILKQYNKIPEKMSKNSWLDKKLTSIKHVEDTDKFYFPYNIYTKMLSANG